MNQSVIQIILYFIVLIYMILSVITVLGMRKRFEVAVDYEPTISIIIAARNEENSLPECLKTLGNQDYPRDKIEIILVNDRSSDKTGKIMSDFIQTVPNSKMITIYEDPYPFTGKINSLIRGVKASSGEILLFTDGDCEVSSTWIRTMVQAYNSDTGLVGGFLFLDRKKEKSPLFYRVQSLDWIHLASVGSGWANLGHPISAFGNNLSIRRQVYNLVGGFEAVANHITEDFILTRNVDKITDYHINLYLNSGNVVYTRPVKNLQELFSQKRRWAIGGRSHGMLAFVLMGTTFLAHLLVVVNIATGHYSSGMGSFLILIMSDAFLLFKPLKILKRLDLMRYIFLYELYFFAYTLFLAPILLFARSVKWKSFLYISNKTRKNSKQ